MTTTTDLAPVAGSTGPAGTLRRLDTYGTGLVEDQPRVEALALISCGYRAPGQGDRPGLPRASRREDARRIHLHDPDSRAPRLAAALEAGEYRRLTIAFPVDDPAAFVLQRFTRYSQTRLEAYGDEHAATFIDASDPKKPVHRTFEKGSPEYERLVRTCKADTRIAFCLAEWTDQGPEVIFPDGLGFYALRTTSRHSVRSILQTLAYTQRFTGGRLAGLPFELSVTFREVAGTDGSKRMIPVWTITTRPPEGIRLSSRTFAGIATAALQQGAALMLPAPDAGSWEDAEALGPPVTVEEPSADDLDQLERGGLCDAEHYRRLWFATASGTRFDAEQDRHAWLMEATRGRFNSLASFLGQASEAEASALLARFALAVAREKAAMDPAEQARLVATYDAIYREDDDAPTPSATVDPEPQAAPPPVDEWRRRSELEARAQAVGLPVPTLRVDTPVDQVREDNDALEARIRDREIDTRLAQQEAF